VRYEGIVAVKNINGYGINDCIIVFVSYGKKILVRYLRSISRVLVEIRR